MRQRAPTPNDNLLITAFRQNSGYRLRLMISLLLIIAIVVIGDVGYYFIEGWPLMDGLYMTVITLTTIGYGEVHPLSPAGRIFTIALIVASLTVVGYAITNLTGFIVEGELNRVIWGLRMDKQIEQLKDHIILCGGGRTGRHAAMEFHNLGAPFVVVEQDPDVLQQLKQCIGGLLYLRMDATEDETLLLAGITRARGLVAALAEDKDNVFVVLSARALNPNLRIVSRLLEDQNADKLRKAGADKFVSANVVGGYRLASEMLRPTVVDFVDTMLRDADPILRIEELSVEPGSPLAETTLGELDLGRRTGTLVIAIRPTEGGYRFNPGSQTELSQGDVLIVMGTPDQVAQLRGLRREGG